MIIRALLPNEIVFLKEMLYTAIFVGQGAPTPPHSIIESPALAKYIQNFGSKQHDYCLVASEDDELLGACWVRLFNENDKGFGYVNATTPELSIAIKKQHRNRGIGTRLIKQMIIDLKKKNINALSLSVDKENPAMKLYKKLGFLVVNETEKSAVMRLEL